VNWLRSGESTFTSKAMQSQPAELPTVPACCSPNLAQQVLAEAVHNLLAAEAAAHAGALGHRVQDGGDRLADLLRGGTGAPKGGHINKPTNNTMLRPRGMHCGGLPGSGLRGELGQSACDRPRPPTCSVRNVRSALGCSP
jgi:hypothetical protein